MPLRIISIALLIGFASSANAKGFADKSPLSTPDMAVCTAAAMKSGQGFDLYKRWVGALEARYKIIYSNLSPKEVDSYTAERVMDKKRSLNKKGIQTSSAFKNFYSVNCSDSTP
jgi:hypothetical protein